MTITRLEFFKQTLQTLIDNRNKFYKLDDFIKETFNPDMYSNIGSMVIECYQDMLIDTLSYMWKEQVEVQDWICYLIYEVSENSDKNKPNVFDTENNKEYKIYDVESLTEYLLEYYTILGECK